MPHALTHEWLETPKGRIAYRAVNGAPPTVVFLGGLFSDMAGDKASALEQACRSRGQAFVRFDYRGHGNSDGTFSDLVLSDWLVDTLEILNRKTEGPLILVGSSMGGWLMFLAALRLPDRVQKLVGIAAAPDFTEDLIFARMPKTMQDELRTKGRIEAKAYYPETLSWRVIEDGRQNLLLRQDIPLTCDIHLLQGGVDTAVPIHWPDKIKACLPKAGVTIIHIADGDHRLSRPQDIALLLPAVFGESLDAF